MGFMQTAHGQFAFGWHLHLFFGVAAFLGVVFLLMWAHKSFDKKQMKQWTLWLLVVGIVGSLLTSQYSWKSMKYKHSMMDGKTTEVTESVTNAS